jgi:hypothetical protein
MKSRDFDSLDDYVAEQYKYKVPYSKWQESCDDTTIQNVKTILRPEMLLAERKEIQLG